MDKIENCQKIIGNDIDSLDYEFLVEYKDGGVLKQNFNTPNEKHFGHVDIDRVESMWLVNRQGNKVLGVDVVNQCFIYNDLKFYVQFSGGNEFTSMHPIYFRRVRRTFNEEEEIVIRHCLGLQQNIDGKNYKELWFINPDGTITISQVQ